jgi:hypothetical protein
MSIPFLPHAQAFHGSLCLAGGSVVNLLRPVHQMVSTSVQDLDFFIVAPSKQAAAAVLQNVLTYLAANAEHVHAVIFSSNAVTIKMVPKYTDVMITLQIMLHAYPSVAAVVHSFDITWCMAAFTGTNVLLAQLCCAAMQRGYGIVTSPIRQSAKRLRKYLQRGMPTVVPETPRWKRVRNRARRNGASSGAVISKQRGHVVSCTPDFHDCAKHETALLTYTAKQFH